MGKMSSDQFCTWLQGFMELSNPTELSAIQTQIVKDHLDLVFDKVTPNRIAELTKNSTIEELFDKNKTYENFEPLILPTNEMEPKKSVSKRYKPSPQYCSSSERKIC